MNALETSMLLSKLTHHETRSTPKVDNDLARNNPPINVACLNSPKKINTHSQLDSSEYQELMRKKKLISKSKARKEKRHSLIEQARQINENDIEEKLFSSDFVKKMANNIKHKLNSFAKDSKSSNVESSLVLARSKPSPSPTFQQMPHQHPSILVRLIFSFYSL